MLALGDALTVTGVSVELVGIVGVLSGGFEVLLKSIVVPGVWVTCDDFVLSSLVSQVSHNTITPSLHINPEHQLFPLMAKSPSS